jgi:hypothetical protein
MEGRALVLPGDGDDEAVPRAHGDVVPVIKVGDPSPIPSITETGSVTTFPFVVSSTTILGCACVTTACLAPVQICTSEVAERASHQRST